MPSQLTVSCFFVIKRLLILLLLCACGQATETTELLPTSITAVSTTETAALITPAATSPLLRTATPLPTITPLSSTATPTLTPTPFYTGELSAPCGQQLPLFTTNAVDPVLELNPSSEAVDAIREVLPVTAVPAFDYILSNPQNVGLVAYRAGQEADGIFLNENVAMPLASVVKIIHLVAYAESVAAGALDPLSTIALSEFDRYQIPNFDLGAHRRAVAELEENGRLFGTPPQMLLDEVPWMMVRHSSNGATDYLHRLLGQEQIEETAVSLGLTTQTAPCPFLGQFLAMGNHTRAESDHTVLDRYLADPPLYGEQVTLFADAFIEDDQFRKDEFLWRSGRRRPSIETQRYFTANLNPQASANEYAQLMMRIAQNGLSSTESSFTVRRYLEWPMLFADNQELFTNLGYKNGTLPSVLTTAYYAYPQGEAVPIVVILFFRDLPNDTYQRWRRTLPHDEFARWLLYDETAVELLSCVISEDC